MKVKAKHWLNFDGVWHRAGETFEISTADAGRISEHIETAETPVTDEVETEMPKKRGRPKRTDTVDSSE